MRLLKPHALLDEMLHQGCFKNDAELGKAIGTLAPGISAIRNGRLAVGDSFRIKAMRLFDWSLAYVDHLAPPKESK